MRANEKWLYKELKVQFEEEELTDQGVYDMILLGLERHGV